MRSATDRPVRFRRLFEWICRGIALALIAWMLFDAIRDDDAPGVIESVRSADLDTRLASLMYSERSGGIHVETNRALDAIERSWLRALARNGRQVSWSGRPPALAISADPVVDPLGRALVTIAAPSERWIRLEDDAGVIDSVQARRLGAELELPALEGAAIAELGETVATATMTDSVVLRDVVVLGRPSWETRFVVAALEEAGWKVSMRVPLAPERAVEQGAVVLDTSRVGAVIALDSTAAQDANAIARFVRGGGGLVLTSEAALSRPPLASLAAGDAGPMLRASLIESGDSLTRDGLALRPIAARSDAIPLELRDQHVAIAARRVGAGRVAQLGYADTWRWRMSGGDSGLVAHRRWWSALVATVAYAPLLERPSRARIADPAPLASTVHALGAPRAFAASQRFHATIRPGIGVLLATLALLLAEWGSRRLRGVP